MITLILKGTDGCNLNCAYCSLGEKTSHHVISEEMLFESLRYVCRMAQRRGEPRITVILHGGEPTLVPAEEYRNAFTTIQREFPDISVTISVQTNAFHISSEMFQFFRDFHAAAGVSIDGSQKIHDGERKSCAGQNTFSQVWDNIGRLQEQGNPVSCLMVLTGAALREPLDYLHDFADRHLHLKINPLLQYGEAVKNPQLFLKPGEYAEYLIRVYEYILAERIELTVSPLDKILQAVLTEKQIRECTFDAQCSRSFLCIDWKGDIYPCGKFSDIHAFCLGNVKDRDTELLQTPQLKRLLERRCSALPEACRACSFLEICHAGCSAEAVIEGAFDQPTALCSDYQRLFRYFQGDGLRYFKKHLLERKRELLGI